VNVDEHDYVTSRNHTCCGFSLRATRETSLRFRGREMAHQNWDAMCSRAVKEVGEKGIVSQAAPWKAIHARDPGSAEAGAGAKKPENRARKGPRQAEARRRHREVNFS